MGPAGTGDGAGAARFMAMRYAKDVMMDSSDSIIEFVHSFEIR